MQWHATASASLAWCRQGTLRRPTSLLSTLSEVPRNSVTVAGEPGFYRHGKATGTCKVRASRGKELDCRMCARGAGRSAGPVQSQSCGLLADQAPVGERQRVAEEAERVGAAAVHLRTKSGG